MLKWGWAELKDTYKKNSHHNRMVIVHVGSPMLVVFLPLLWNVIVELPIKVESTVSSRNWQLASLVFQFQPFCLQGAMQGPLKRMTWSKGWFGLTLLFIVLSMLVKNSNKWVKYPKLGIKNSFRRLGHVRGSVILETKFASTQWPGISFGGRRT